MLLTKGLRWVILHPLPPPGIELVDWCINIDELVLVNNVLKEKIEIYYINIVYISRETFEENSVKTVVDNDGIMWLNENHIEQGLDHKKLLMTSVEYLSHHKKTLA